MFWKNFIKLCNEHGTKPNPVAQELGIASGSITKWKNGAIPRDTTLQKLADYFGVSVDYLLGKDASPSPRPSKNVLRVPVYGQVAAGIPIEAIEDIDDYEELDADDYPYGEYIALKIHGRSMEPRMMEGDVVIVHLQDDVDSGDVAVVMVDGGDATCKKIQKTPEGVCLLSTNPEYAPIFYSNQDIIEKPVRVLGKVVELRVKY